MMYFFIFVCIYLYVMYYFIRRAVNARKSKAASDVELYEDGESFADSDDEILKDTISESYQSVEDMLRQRDMFNTAEEKQKSACDDNVVNKNTIVNDFDMKKAVIYAEILNPKFKE